MRILSWLLLLSLVGFTVRQVSADEGGSNSPPARAAAATRPPATRGDATAELLAEIRRLRQEVAALNAKVERLDQAIGQAKPGTAGGAVPAGKSALPPEVQAFHEAEKILARYKQQRAAVRKEARRQIGDFRVQIAAALKKVQDRYTRDAKLDEAVAIRDWIGGLKQGRLNVLPDPGMVQSNAADGRVLYFRVTGDNTGAVWGTGVYTTDASLAAAAVHAGVLKAGQTGVVKVTTIPSYPSFEASFRNGIQSQAYGSYAGFTVEPADEGADDYADDADEFSESASAASRPVASVAQPNGRPMPSGETTEQAPSVAPAELPADARKLVERFEAQRASVRKDANRKIGQLRRQTVSALTPLQDVLTRHAKLDEAVAVRDWILALKASGLKAQPDPGTLVGRSSTPVSVLYFRVVGRSGGTVRGTDIYTSDSTLAAAAVHAGVLNEGQTGVVKVTLLPGQSHYTGTTRNGVASSGCGWHSSSYRVASAADAEWDDPDAETNPSPGP